MISENEQGETLRRRRNIISRYINLLPPTFRHQICHLQGCSMFYILSAEYGTIGDETVDKLIIINIAFNSMTVFNIYVIKF